VSLPGLVATGADEHELATATQAVRAQVAFYGATPAYRSVLSLHGLDGLHEELHRLSKEGEWAAMTALVDDGVLAEFAVVGTAEEAGAEVRRRYEGLVDRITLAAPYPMSEEVRRDLIAAIKDD
jgi:alkanesulfonate monooxygenase SsuD/methylene tetrahydromethanopterin reductase-like flavin-dependent oxidoreductase (luciferase family)